MEDYINIYHTDDNFYHRLFVLCDRHCGSFSADFVVKELPKILIKNLTSEEENASLQKVDVDVEYVIKKSF